ncbi:hypothetical protein AK812_SmicGene16018 [Symbiodinium microadriaticum]|uniref:Uncharacterized protein n=1 Tax=Symbiodinium microadriaticum TaxID=2951 RepID=A0A1Q9E1G4_SYMMI|nr:hypothetical protein AK812_SmicGene16018 [Symbiodinium microadriaticum]
MCLVSSLISGCTGAATGLSVPARFANAVCGYALLLLNLQAARRHFGQDWARHFLPLVTVRNLCQLLFQQMANCTILPKDACVRPACMQEKVCEYQYSQVKAPFRGKEAGNSLLEIWLCVSVLDMIFTEALVQSPRDSLRASETDLVVKCGTERTRLLPQYAGSAYRSMVGLPGGFRSPLLPVLQKHAKAQGADPDNRDLGMVYIYDSKEFPAHLAEEKEQVVARLSAAEECPSTVSRPWHASAVGVDGQRFVDLGQKFVDLGQKFVDLGQKFVDLGQKFVDLGQNVVDLDSWT